MFLSGRLGEFLIPKIWTIGEKKKFINTTYIHFFSKSTVRTTNDGPPGEHKFSISIIVLELFKLDESSCCFLSFSFHFGRDIDSAGLVWRWRWVSVLGTAQSIMGLLPMQCWSDKTVSLYVDGVSMDPDSSDVEPDPWLPKLLPTPPHSTTVYCSWVYSKFHGGHPTVGKSSETVI